MVILSRFRFHLLILSLLVLSNSCCLPTSCSLFVFGDSFFYGEMTPSKVRVGGVFCVVLTSISGNSLSFLFSFIDFLSPCAVE